MADEMEKWYYSKEGRKCGPIEFSELERLAQHGEITRDTLVWRKGLKGWITAERVLGLFPHQTEKQSVEPPPLPPQQTKPFKSVKPYPGVATKLRVNQRNEKKNSTPLWKIAGSAILGFIVMAILTSGGNSEQSNAPPEDPFDRDVEAMRQYNQERQRRMNAIREAFSPNTGYGYIPGNYPERPAIAGQMTPCSTCSGSGTVTSYSVTNTGGKLACSRCQGKGWILRR